MYDIQRKMVTDGQLVIMTDFPRRLVTVRPVHRACVSHTAAELCGLCVCDGLDVCSLCVCDGLDVCSLCVCDGLDVSRCSCEEGTQSRCTAGSDVASDSWVLTEIENGSWDERLSLRAAVWHMHKINKWHSAVHTRLATDWLSLADCRLHLLRLCALAS